MLTTVAGLIPAESQGGLYDQLDSPTDRQTKSKFLKLTWSVFVVFEMRPPKD